MTPNMNKDRVTKAPLDPSSIVSGPMNALQAMDY